MKLTIGQFEVNITAKNAVTEKTATDAFLNELSLALMYAARWEEAQDMPAIARATQKEADDVYDFLDAKGYYKK